MNEKDAFDEALEKVKRVSVGGSERRRGQTRSAAPAVGDPDDRIQRIEERLLAVEEALHALQSKLST